MAKAKGYNGYKNYAQWNQSLWLNNDEGLYNLARESVSLLPTRQEAVEYILCTLHGAGMTHTPDGVKWSKAGILAGLAGM